MASPDSTKLAQKPVPLQLINQAVQNVNQILMSRNQIKKVFKIKNRTPYWNRRPLDVSYGVPTDQDVPLLMQIEKNPINSQKRTFWKNLKFSAPLRLHSLLSLAELTSQCLQNALWYKVSKNGRKRERKKGKEAICLWNFHFCKS